MSKPNLITNILSAANTFSRSLVNIAGYFNYSLAGTWEGTVTLQRSFDTGATWRDVDSHTSNIETYGIEPGENVQYRFGFKAGEYTSGACTGRIECPKPSRRGI